MIDLNLISIKCFRKNRNETVRFFGIQSTKNSTTDNPDILQYYGLNKSVSILHKEYISVFNISH